MRCKICGSENSENAKFCTVCGSPMPKPSKAKKIMAALGKMICYVLLFVGVQSLVMGIYMFQIGMSIGMEYVKDGSFGYYMNYDEMMNRVYQMMGDGIHYVMILSAVITILILALFYSISHRYLNNEIELRPIPWTAYPQIAIGAVAFQFFVGITMGLLPIPEETIKSFEEMSVMLLGGSLIIQLIDVAIFTPITEEIIFRGMIFTRLRKAMPVWVSVAVSSVVFGALHGHIISFVYASILGVVMSLLMVKFKSIVAPMIFHICFNGASFISLGENDIVYIVVYIASILILAAVTAMIIYNDPIS